MQLALGALAGLAAAVVLDARLRRLDSELGVWLALALVTLSAGLAPTFRRALGRSFLGLGARLLSSADQHRDAVWQRHRQHDADQRREDRRGGALMVGPAGILGFIVGGLLLVVGLVLSLGGRHA